MLQHLLVIGSFLAICGLIHWGMKKIPSKTVNKDLLNEEPVKKAV